MTAKRHHTSSEKLCAKIEEYAKTKSPGMFLEILLDIEAHTLDTNGHHLARARIIGVTRAWIAAFAPLPSPKAAAEACQTFARAEKKSLVVREVWEWLALLANAAYQAG